MIKRLCGEPVNVLPGMLLEIEGLVCTECIVLDPGSSENSPMKCIRMSTKEENTLSGGSSILVNNVIRVFSAVPTTIDTPLHYILSGAASKSVMKAELLWTRRATHPITNSMVPFITVDTLVYDKRWGDMCYVKYVKPESKHVELYSGGCTSRSTTGGSDSYAANIHDLLLPEDEYNRLTRLVEDHENAKKDRE